MSDISVQRGRVDYGAAADSATANITAVGSLSNAWARLANTQIASGGVTAGSILDKQNRDFASSCVLGSTSTVDFARDTLGENVDYRHDFEVWEYTGAPGGPNEFIVRFRGTVFIGSGVTQVDTVVSGIVNINNCIPFIVGTSSGVANRGWERAAATAEMVFVTPDNKVRITRGDSNSSVTLNVVVVEFTGSNWKVQNNISHTIAATGVTETETITAVSALSKACVFSSHRQGLNRINECGWNCWFANTTTLNFRIRSGANKLGQVIVAHVLEHPNLSVQHLDSITGGGTAHAAGTASPQTINEAISAVAALSTTGLFATHDVDGAVTTYTQQSWDYRLTSTTNVEFWRGRHGAVGDWALQVIDFSGIVGNLEVNLPVLTSAVAPPLSLGVEYDLNVLPAQASMQEIQPEHSLPLLGTVASMVTMAARNKGSRKYLKRLWGYCKYGPW